MPLLFNRQGVLQQGRQASKSLSAFSLSWAGYPVKIELIAGAPCKERTSERRRPMPGSKQEKILIILMFVIALVLFLNILRKYVL